MNSIIYEPHRRKQARRDLNKTSLKWDAVCAKLKQLKSPSPTKTFWRKNLRIVRVDPSEILDRVFCRCGLVDVYQVKFKVSRKATKNKISQLIWFLLSKRQIKWKTSLNFCVLITYYQGGRYLSTRTTIKLTLQWNVTTYVVFYITESDFQWIETIYIGWLKFLSINWQFCILYILHTYPNTIYLMPIYSG